MEKYSCSFDTDTLSSDINMSEEIKEDYDMFSSQSQSKSQLDPMIPIPNLEDYEDLLATVRSELLRERRKDSIHSIAKYFNNTLDHTYSLILKTFDIIRSQLAEEGAAENPTRIHTYLDNASTVIQSLTKYIKDTSEQMEMPSELFDAFPKQGVLLLRDVFEHCKNSETLYRDKIGVAQENLKELFRSCTDLHRVYLDVLHNRMVFDNLNDNSRYQSFVDVMSCITAISDIVIFLDVRTLADNCKMFVAVCEKYAGARASEVVLSRSIPGLQLTIMRTVKSCVEDHLEQKALVRSLKVANFLLKILIKLCQLFKYYNSKGYTPLLIFIKSNAETYLRSIDMPDQMIELMRSHVTAAAEPLLAELLECEPFAEEVLENVGVSQTEFCSMERGVLGYGLLLASTMSAVLQSDEPATRNAWLSGDPDRNIICRVLKFVSQPKCHIWLSYGLKFEMCVKKGDPPKCCGLYEHLLTVTAVLSATVDAEQYAAIERTMLTTLLQGNEWASLFAADLWVILARYGPTELCVDQVTTLTGIYNELREKQGKLKSPQSVHLRSTLQRLFATLSHEDRLAIYDDSNAASRHIFVQYLPEVRAKEISELAFRKLETELRKLTSCSFDKEYDMYYLIDTINETAQCLPSERAPLEALVECWQKCYIQAPMSLLLGAEETSVQGRRWFTDLVLALCELTSCLCAHQVIDNKHLIQILHVLDSIIEKSSSALKMSTTLLSELAAYKIKDDIHAPALCAVLAKLFQKLLEDNDPTVQARALVAFRQFSLRTNNESLIQLVCAKSDSTFKELLLSFMKNGDVNIISNTDWMKRVEETSHLKFTHKCKVANDFDNFSGDSYGEGAGKKMKFNSEAVPKPDANWEVVESVFGRIESCVTDLNKLNSALSYNQSHRLLMLIEKLKQTFKKLERT